MKGNATLPFSRINPATGDRSLRIPKVCVQNGKRLLISYPREFRRKIPAARFAVSSLFLPPPRRGFIAFIDAFHPVN